MKFKEGELLIDTYDGTKFEYNHKEDGPTLKKEPDRFIRYKDRFLRGKKTHDKCIEDIMGGHPNE